MQIYPTDRIADHDRQTLIDGDRADEAADMQTTRSQLHIEAQGEAYWDGLSDAEEGKPNRNPHNPERQPNLWAAYEAGYLEGEEGDTE
ncbi:MAG: hypothetical protein KBG20_22085 [Caldilineaceae bacterium]|nr:hypothetical protein [Caldilineaceae bacterium]